MNVFVTGIDGFLGSRLAQHLIDRGHRVSGLVLDREAAGGRGLPAEAQLVEGDLQDAEALRSTLAELDPDWVVHLAGLSHVGQSWQEMARYFQINFVGTANVLTASPRSLLFASSSEVYGHIDPDQLPVSEEMPVAPASPYALLKAAAERLVIDRGAIVVRMFNLVGPGQAPEFALPSFARQLAAIERGDHEPVLAVGNLSARRDFVHVDDATAALELLLRRGESGTVYNVATGAHTELSVALERLIAIAGVQARVERDPARDRPADVPAISGDASRLEALGWRPSRDLERALADLWSSVRDGDL